MDVVVSSVSKVDGGVGGGAFFGIGAEGFTLGVRCGNPRCVVTGEADRPRGLEGERGLDLGRAGGNLAAAAACCRRA